MKTFLLFYKGQAFAMKGQTVYAAKQHAAALLNISPKQLTLA